VGGVLARGRAGAIRTAISRPGNGGSSNRSSGSGSSETLFISAVRGCVTGFTCTAVAQGISGRFLMLHPSSMHMAQQRKTMAELEK